ncbi:type II secretion system protein, partial [Pseudomonadota bacterium]
MKKLKTPFFNLIKPLKAFTLIELSVVLMIIALLVTGIVGGTRLIKSAKMAKLISETSDYVKEFNV